MLEGIRNHISKHDIYPWLIFISVTTATFMINVDSSILNVALPILEGHFQVSPQVLQWVISSYLLIITGILPTIGKLSDMFGRKLIFIAGFMVFVLGSILSAISISIGQLILFRSVQGIGSAIMQGNVMSIVANTFTKGSRGKALGIIGSVVAAGTIMGPSIGGFLITNFGWRSVFWINVPIGIIGIIGSVILLPTDKKTESTGQLDYMGSISFFIAMTSLLVYVSNGQTWGFFTPTGLAILLIAIISWILFIYWELKVKNPIIDLSFFRIPTFTIGNFVGYSSYILIMFPSILMPLYLHNVAGLQVDKIGFIMASQAIAMLIAAPISGFMSDKIGNHWPSLIGMSVSSFGLWLMAQIGITTNTTFIVIAIFLFGLGMGLFQSPNNVAVIESVPVESTGVTGSIIATVRNFGRVSGVSITIFLLFFFLQFETTMEGYSDSVSTVFYIGSLFALLNVIILINPLLLTKLIKQNS